MQLTAPLQNSLIVPSGVRTSTDMRLRMLNKETHHQYCTYRHTHIMTYPSPFSTHTPHPYTLTIHTHYPSIHTNHRYTLPIHTHYPSIHTNHPYTLPIYTDLIHTHPDTTCQEIINSSTHLLNSSRCRTSYSSLFPFCEQQHTVSETSNDYSEDTSTVTGNSLMINIPPNITYFYLKIVPPPPPPNTYTHTHIPL